MVTVIYGDPHGGGAGPVEDVTAGATGPTALIHIHSVVRHVHGNCVKIESKGEIKIAAGQYVYARELKLNTLQVLILTPDLNVNNGLGYMSQKYINHKGEYGNYASIDVYDDASTWQSPGVGPVDGSIWLDFIAEGDV